MPAVRGAQIPARSRAGGVRPAAVGPARPRHGRRWARIISAAFSAIIITGALVLPEVIVGMTEASAMRSPSRPRSRRRSSTTAARIGAHPAGADRVEDGGADRARGLGQLVRRSGSAGPGLSSCGRKRASAGGRADPPGQPDRVGGDLAVAGGGEVVRPDRGRRAGLAALDPDRAAALRAQVADRGGERREGVQRLAEPVERERLDVVFEVRRSRAPGRTARRRRAARAPWSRARAGTGGTRAPSRRAPAGGRPAR